MNDTPVYNPTLTMLCVAAALGIAANVVPFLAFSLGCAMSHWTCRGDGMGGILTLYAFGLFIPNVVVGFVALVAVFECSRRLIVRKVPFRAGFRRAVLAYIISFLFIAGVFAIDEVRMHGGVADGDASSQSAVSE